MMLGEGMASGAISRKLELLCCGRHVPGLTLIHVHECADMSQLAPGAALIQSKMLIHTPTPPSGLGKMKICNGNVRL